MNTMNALRQTGRTARMIAAAKEAYTAAGDPIVIIVAYENEAALMRQNFDGYHGVEILTFDDVRVNDSVNSFNFPTMSFKNSDQRRTNEKVFVDHGLLEAYFTTALKELHRWDLYFNINQSE